MIPLACNFTTAKMELETTEMLNRKQRILPLISALTAIVLFLHSFSKANAVTVPRLDTDFNTAGFTVDNGFAGGNGTDYYLGVTVQDDGKIVAVGESSNGTNGDMTVVRYNTDGTLDTTFSSDGIFTHNNAAGGSGADTGYDVVIDGDGKIIIVGASRGSSNTDMAIWRLNADGTLDTDFSDDGYFTQNSAAGGNGNDIAYAVTLQADEKIVVAGVSRATSNDDMAVWRFNTNGTLDTDFSGDGYFTHNNAAGGNSTDIAREVTVQNSGDIVIVGYSTSASNGIDMAVWKIDAADGTLETDFDTDGIFTHNGAAGGTGADYALSVTLQADQNIVIGGASTPSGLSTLDFAIWRLNGTTGALDTTFNSTGYYTKDGVAGGSNLSELVYNILLDADENMILTGYSSNGYNIDFAALRVTNSGTLDTTFGVTGMVSHNSAAGGNGDDISYASVINTDGNYILVGSSAGSNTNAVIMIVLASQPGNAISSDAITWTQVEDDSFGQTSSPNFTSEDFFDIISYQDCVYAGIESRSTSRGAQVWRSCDNGGSWTKVNDDGFGNLPNNDHVDSMAEFNGYLYVSTGTPNSSHDGTEIWRSATGDVGTWTQVNTSGFGTGQNENFKGMKVFNGRLCGGTWNSTSGAGVWCSSDGTTWEQVNDPGFGSTSNNIIWFTEVYDDYFYASVQNSTTGGQLWRSSDLETWTPVFQDGLGFGTNESTVRIIGDFNGGLYVAAKNGKMSNHKIYKSSNGTTFEEVFSFPGYDDDGPGRGGFTNDTHIFVVTSNFTQGARVYSSSNGENWTQINIDGFSNTRNQEGVITENNGYLYVGVGNYYTGHQIWRASSADVPITTQSTSAEVNTQTIYNCSSAPPSTAPRLIQVDVQKENKAAKLYFVPANGPLNYYFVQYGLHGYPEATFGTEFAAQENEELYVLDIYDLDNPGKYFFKVRAGNNCAPGNWSNQLDGDLSGN